MIARTCLTLLATALLTLPVWAQQGVGPVQTQPSQSVELAPRQVPTTQPADTDGRIELSLSEFNFGEVWQGTTATCEVTVRNTGKGPLTIDHVRSSCGCTVPTQPKSPLAPGESGTFTITYRTDKEGEAHKYVMVYHNDSTKDWPIRIAVEGSVKPLFVMEPDQITFPNLDEDTRAQQVVRFRNQYEHPIELTLRERQSFGRFAVELKEVEKGREYELRVQTVPPMQPGHNRCSVTLNTTFAALPTMTYFVTGNVVQPVSVAPQRLHVTSRYVSPSPRLVRVMIRKDKNIEITQVKSSNESITYELLPPGPEGPNAVTMTRTIRVTVPPYAEVPAEGAQLVIYTNAADPAYQKIEVPIVRYNTTAVTRQPAPGKPTGGPTPVRPDNE